MRVTDLFTKALKIEILLNFNNKEFSPFCCEAELLGFADGEERITAKSFQELIGCDCPARA
jgi:hypothetical protein